MISRPLKLGFMASRNGSSARAVVAAIRAGTLAGEARLMVSNNAAAPALDYAASQGVPCLCIPTKADPEAADAQLCAAMVEAGVELIVLSGYLRRLGPATLRRFAGRVLNIHPGPLPAFGGEGMYGRRVHESVIAAGVSASGAAVHLVEAEYDRGPILAQRSLDLAPGETAESLEAKITALEPPFFVEVLRQIASGALTLPD